MSYNLKDVEALKTYTFEISLSGLTSTSPAIIEVLKNSANVNFIPDFVIVKQVSYFDGNPTDSSSVDSSGVYVVNASFIPDNDVLCSINPVSVMQSNTSSYFYSGTEIIPNICHKFRESNQLIFTISTTYYLHAPSATSILNITLEFVKLKK